MHLSAFLTAKSEPFPFILERINANEVVETARGKSNKHARLGILAKLADAIDGADETLVRRIDIAVL